MLNMQSTEEYLGGYEPEYNTLYAENLEVLEDLKQDARSLGAIPVGGVFRDVANPQLPDTFIYGQTVRWLTDDELHILDVRMGGYKYWRGRGMGLSIGKIEGKEQKSYYKKKHVWQEVRAVETQTIEPAGIGSGGPSDESPEGKRIPGATVILTLACGHKVRRAATRYVEGQRVRCPQCTLADRNAKRGMVSARFNVAEVNRASDPGGLYITDGTGGASGASGANVTTGAGASVGTVSKTENIKEWMPKQESHRVAKNRTPTRRLKENDVVRLYNPQTVESNVVTDATGRKWLNGMPVLTKEDMAGSGAGAAIDKTVVVESEPEPDWYDSPWTSGE
jgi:hypothetical protein